MLFSCDHCKIQQDAPRDSPFCLQCGQQWVAVSASLEAPAQQFYPGTDSGQSPTTEPTSDGTGSSVLRDSERENDSTIPPDAVETQSESEATAPEETDVSLGTARAMCPFLLTVNKRPQSSQSTSVSLEVRLTNLSSEEFNGRLWLTDKAAAVGTPVSFQLPPPFPLGSPATDTLCPQLNLSGTSLTHIAVRIHPAGNSSAFWQGDLLLQIETDGRIAIDVDKSIRTDTHLGGIDNSSVNIYANTVPDPENWRPVDLRLRGPKDLAHPDDFRRPLSDAKVRKLRIRDLADSMPEVSTARLTLSTELESGQEAYVQLIAGRTLHLGRARIWDSGQHQLNQPNDVVLRTHADDEEDGYISRYHGCLAFDEHEIRYTNLSGCGTDIDGLALQPDESRFLRDGALIRPGHSQADQQNNSLGLRLRRTTCPLSHEDYELLVQDSHLGASLSEVERQDVATLLRTDRNQNLEHYILFQQATLVGRSATICGWQIDHPSVDLRHAMVLWFDESFWIEPFRNDCEVQVNGTAVAANHLRRLSPGSVLAIGQQEFLVQPQWRQHLVECDSACCKRHGAENGCQCSRCRK